MRSSLKRANWLPKESGCTLRKLSDQIRQSIDSEAVEVTLEEFLLIPTRGSVYQEVVARFVKSGQKARELFIQWSESPKKRNLEKGSVRTSIRVAIDLLDAPVRFAIRSDRVFLIRQELPEGLVFGENTKCSPSAKLTVSEVREIFTLKDTGRTKQSIVEEFAERGKFISRSAVKRIWSRTNWEHVTADSPEITK